MAIATGWIIGWVLGVVVVALVAVLVVSITAVAQRIARQAQGITESLDGTRANTTALWEVRATNHAIDRITRGLRRIRTGGSEG